MHDHHRRVDRLRRGRSELDNQVIDELRTGGLSRRDFLRVASVVGIGLPLAGALAGPAEAAVRTATPTSGAPTTTSVTPLTVVGTTAPAGKRSALLRVAVLAPAGKLDPVTVIDEGGLCLLGQTGEYLSFSNGQMQLEPRIATAWKPNADGSMWTFTIRSGVTFSNGKPLTADDVVATFERLADPANKSAALSVFKGVLSKGNTKKVNDTTVTFTLDGPNGNFPALVSSDNYNAIILPRDYAGDWEKTFIGSGPWILEKYTVGQSATFTRNPKYWDPTRQPRFDRLAISLYKDEKSAVSQLQAGQIDAIAHFSVANGSALLTDPKVTVQALRSSAHRQIHMRTDTGVFADKRVRQAMALTLDRPALVKGLFNGKADLGNDSPFAPAFPSTDTTVPQRAKDITKAKALLDAAGASKGFTVQLDTWPGLEIPDLAQLVASAAKEIGITVTLNIKEDYYDKAWLNSTMGITDYGHRGVPNVFLGAPLQSDGTWNAAHFKNPTYDSLVQDYTRALDPASQKTAARKIETMLLDETPLVIPYFYQHLTAVKKGLTGLKTTGMGHLDASQAALT